MFESHQVLANVSSAGLIPLMLLLKDPETQNMSKANWVLATGVAATGLFYLTFNGSYRRLEADREYEARKRRTPRANVEL
jgi:drug/metabolite transporter (DMT)-like permease